MSGHAHLEVLSTGPLALPEDLGRRGHAGIGVGRSGAADRGALRLANRLVANPEGFAAIEITFGGLEVVAHGCDAWIAVTGAPAPLSVDGSAAAARSVVLLRDGQHLAVGQPEHGLRSYLAVRGGFDVAETLGSRSSDIMSDIGPGALAVGDLLPIGPAPSDFPALDLAPAAPAPEGIVTLGVVRGPRDEWIDDVDLLVNETWSASDRSNRVGMRLEGQRLAHRSDRRDDQLPSEGAYRGAIQVPPGGQPVVFLADHPVTGGYPVVGVVIDADVDRAAQVRPGQSLRFRWVRA